MARDTNVFRYVGNTPTAATDPSGEDGGITLFMLALIGGGLFAASGCGGSPIALAPPRTVLHVTTMIGPDGLSLADIQDTANQLLKTAGVGPELLITMTPPPKLGWDWNYNLHMWEYHQTLIFDYKPDLPQIQAIA